MSEVVLKSWQMYDARGVGAKLKEARDAKRLSLAEVGRRVEKHHSHISQIEKGEHIVGWDLLARIADVLGLSLDALLERDVTRIVRS